MLYLNVIALPSALEVSHHLRDIGLGTLPLLLILATALLWVLYSRSLKSALNLCSPDSRTITPEEMWLLLIPGVRTLWQFWTVSGLAASLGNEFKKRNLPNTPSKPGKALGLTMCILPILTALTAGVAIRIALVKINAPLIAWLAWIGLALALAGVVLWIAYWVKIAGYSRLLAKALPVDGADSPTVPLKANRAFFAVGIAGLFIALALSLPSAVGFLLFVASGRAVEAADAYAAVYPHWYNHYLFSGVYVSRQEVKKVTLMQVRARYPQYADNPVILQVFEQQVGMQLLEQKVLVIEAGKRGLRASDSDVNEFLHQGQFGAFLYPQGKYIGDDHFEVFIQRQFGFTVAEFKQELKQDLAIKKLQDKITTGVTVSDEEVRAAYRKMNAKIKFDYAVIDAGDLLRSINPSESDLQSFFQSNAARYANAVPEQARSRHILIVVAPGADANADAAAKAKAEGLLKQIQGGANFADLAAKNSDDPGSKNQGGELGFAQRGSMVPEFEKALFTQKIGEAQIVKSQFGYHIVQVEERTTAHTPSFAEWKGHVADDYRREQLPILVKAKGAELLAKAKAGNDLAKAAKESGASFHSNGLVGAGDQVPEIGRVGQVAPQLFDLKPGDLSGPILTGRAGVVAKLVDKQLPTDEEIAKNFSQAREGLLEERKAEAFNNFAKPLMDQYKKQGRIVISEEKAEGSPNL